MSRLTLISLMPRVAAVSFTDNARRGSSYSGVGGSVVLLMFAHVSGRHGNLSIGSDSPRIETILAGVLRYRMGASVVIFLMIDAARLFAVNHSDSCL